MAGCLLLSLPALGLSGWAARAASHNIGHAPVSLLAGTAVVPSAPMHDDRPVLMNITASSAEHSALSKSLSWRPPHGYVLDHPVGTLPQGMILRPESVSTWEAMERGHLHAAILTFASFSYVWWNGAQQAGGCLSLLQPVLHNIDGAWQMDIWYIPYFPRDKALPGHGSSRTSAPAGNAYMPLLAGERVTMGLALVSDGRQRAPPMLQYMQWWSLTAHSTPSPTNTSATRNYEIVYDACDPFGEGGDCLNCALFAVPGRRSRAARLASGRRVAGLQECSRACCDNPKCRAINFREANLTCDLLGAHDDELLVVSAEGWSVYVLGQAMTSTVDASWTDPNGHDCSTPASWTLGAVLEVFSADAPSQMPPTFTMANISLHLVGQPATAPLPSWNTWLSADAQTWNMSVEISDEGRTIDLVVPRAQLSSSADAAD